MEEIHKDSEEEPEPSVLSESQDFINGQEGKGDPSVEVNEEEESQTQDEEEESQKMFACQRIIQLQRDLTTLVTNIQTEADAKALALRAELEEARSIRAEQLEDDVKASREKNEEITSGWSVVNRKMTVQELQEALNSQEQLCVSIIGDKKKLINDLQQELKARDDRYVKNLKKNEEEIDLMIERMEEQSKILTKAYREELGHIEKLHEQEIEILLTKDDSTWKQHMKDLWDKQLERLAEKRKMVEEYETKIHDQMLENSSKYSATHIEQSDEQQALQREHQQMKGTNVVMMLNNEKKHNQLVEINNNTVAHMKKMNLSLQAEIKKIKIKSTVQEKEFTKKFRYLSEDYKRAAKQYERMRKEIKHFSVADSRQFQEMCVMIEEELKELVREVLAIDSRICQQHLGIHGKLPPMPFMQLTGPSKPQKRGPTRALRQTGTPSQSSLWVVDASVGPSLESGTESADLFKGATAVQSVAEVEEGTLFSGTMKKVAELLCDEAGFLMEDSLLKLLAPLENEGQSGVKIGLLFSALGIEDRDAPKLADFLLKYEQQQREQTEDACTESGDMAEDTSATANMASELIHPNHVLPALKSFFEQHRRSKASSSHDHSSFWQAGTWSVDEAYWESMCNIIPEDKLRLWDAAEATLMHHHAVLTEISELVPQTEDLVKKNAELRIMLHQLAAQQHDFPSVPQTTKKLSRQK